MTDNPSTKFLAGVGTIVLVVLAFWAAFSLILGAIGVFAGPNTKAPETEYFLECRGQEKTWDILPDIVGGVDMKFCTQVKP